MMGLDLRHGRRTSLFGGPDGRYGGALNIAPFVLVGGCRVVSQFECGRPLAARSRSAFGSYMLGGKHGGTGMPKTHQFTDNASGQPIIVVLDKVATISHDEFSECTTIELIDGKKIGVSDTVEEVRCGTA